MIGKIFLHSYSIPEADVNVAQLKNQVYPHVTLSANPRIPLLL
jgi:hypothetical protein